MKDIVAWNLMIRAALKRVGTYFYCLPKYGHCRKVIWQAMTTDGHKFLDFIPSQIIEKINDQQMLIRFKNGSIIQLIGSDSFDSSIVGTNCVGIVFSEFALADASVRQFTRPILLHNDGWEIICSTPRGKNDLYELYQRVSPPEWFVSKLTIEDTGHISLSQIQRDINLGEMSEHMSAQEYFTNFEIGQEGAIYGRYMDKAHLEGRVGEVPWESGFKVNVVFDLGVADSTVMIFFQVCKQIIRIIDCYENSGKGLDHYAKILEQKGSNGYVYGRYFAPHDIRQRELSTGLSRLEIAKQLGINFTVVPNLLVEDGIESVRQMFNRLWFDKTKCAPLIKAVENYHQEYDNKRKVFTGIPKHNQWSHFCDALRYLSLSLPHCDRKGMTAEDLDKNYNEAMNPNSNLPKFYQDPSQYTPWTY